MLVYRRRGRGYRPSRDDSVSRGRSPVSRSADSAAASCYPPGRLVVVISGRGSNFVAIADAIEAGQLPATIELVVADRSSAAGLAEARRRQLPTAIVDYTSYEQRELFDQALAERIASANPDWVVLAGFMRILGCAVVERFAGRMLNIHPSLLPAYPGLNTHQRVIDDGGEKHGATVHLVTGELDGGPILGQVEVAVSPQDNALLLADRVLNQEHRLYPWVLKLLLEGRMVWTPGAGLALDGVPVPDGVLLGVEREAECQ